MATNQGCKSMIPRSDLDAKFLFYFFKANVPLLESLGTGATFKELSGGKLASVEIPLPPLAEQKRIVALLDEAFAGIDEAKAKAEANQQKATAVFESHLQSLFAIDNPDWARAKLSSLTTKIGSGATPRGGEESYKDEGVSLIRSLNVHDYGFKYEKLAFLDAVQAEELSGVTVQENDVLLNITGASVARCTIVPRGVLPARVNQHVAIIRPMPEKVCSAFLHYLLISQPYKSRLLETGEEGGSTRQAITKAQLLEFAISHPVSIETQQAIAKHLDEIREQTQRLSQLHKQKLDALTALKQSTLSQAFAGELTA
jgi:type I restriction enzyme S subunit